MVQHADHVHTRCRRWIVIVWEPKEQIARAVFGQIRDATVSDAFVKRTDDYAALGFTNGAGTLVGGVVYFNWCSPSVQVAASGLPGWLTPDRVRVMFRFPFVAMPEQGYDIQVIVSHVAKPNMRARQFNKRLGFREVGKVPLAANGKDSIIFAMTKDECRWLKGKQNG